MVTINETLIREILDRLARLEALLEARVDSVESRMATKEDLARLEAQANSMDSRMATKEDLARLEARVDSMESRMATKEDLARLEARVDSMESRMATKEDLAQMETRLVNRMGDSEIRLIKWFVGAMLASVTVATGLATLIERIT